MSKKSRLKRRKYKYTEDEFMLGACSFCRLCKSNTAPTFCYTGVYRDDPRRFMRKILPELMAWRNYLNVSGIRDITTCPEDEIQYMFETAFCDDQYCRSSNDTPGSSCVNILGCLHAFRDQFNGAGNKVIRLDSRRVNTRQEKYKKK